MPLHQLIVSIFQGLTSYIKLWIGMRQRVVRAGWKINFIYSKDIKSVQNHRTKCNQVIVMLWLDSICKGFQIDVVAMEYHPCQKRHISKKQKIMENNSIITKSQSFTQDIHIRLWLWMKLLTWSNHLWDMIDKDLRKSQL